MLFFSFGNDLWIISSDTNAMKHYRIVYSSTVLSDRRRSKTYPNFLSLVRACAVRTPKRYGSKQLSRDSFFAAAVEFVVVSFSLSLSLRFLVAFQYFFHSHWNPEQQQRQTNKLPRDSSPYKHTRGNQIYRTFFFLFHSLKKIAMETRRHTASFRFGFLLFHPLLIRSGGGLRIASSPTDRTFFQVFRLWSSPIDCRFKFIFFFCRALLNGFEHFWRSVNGCHQL